MATTKKNGSSKQPVAGSRRKDGLVHASPRTVAVTGSSGSLGEAVIDQLLRSFPKVKVVALDIAQPHRNHEPERFKFIKRDVRDVTLQKTLKGVDAVIHLAFIVDKTGGLTPKEIESINLDGTRNVFLSGAAAGVKQFVYASSVAAYGMHADVAGELLTEEAPLRGNPDFFYSDHKARVEKWIDGFEKDRPGIRVARLRPSIFLGERSPTRPVRMLAYTPVIPSIRGFDHVRFQIAHEEDIADAFCVAFASNAHGAFNLAAEGTLSLPEIAAEMGKWTFPLPKSVLTIGAVAYRLGLSPWDPDWLIKASRANVAMSTEKALKDLGWNPRYRTAGDVLRAVVGGRRTPPQPVKLAQA
ncbi:MAG: NAD-dependent epimerase/dehydratase family protein [Deltaproteobacteria bacterium]|nr:NAD-dependent epimerase/dehydratase family protein [Deltaproteobacteria bacterium]